MSKAVTRRFDFSGGLNTRSSDIDLAPNQSPSMKNVTLGTTGALRRRPGGTEYHDFGGSPINGLFRHVSGTGNESFMAINGINAYKTEALDPASFSLLYTSLHPDRLWQGTQYEDYLFLANGYNVPMLYDGTNLTTLLDHEDAELPAEWSGTNHPLGFVMAFAGRNEKMFAWHAGDEYASRLFWSEDTNPFNFDPSGAADKSDPGYLDFLKDNGEGIQAVVPMYDLVLVFKESVCGVFAYLDDDTFIDPIYLKQVLPIGCSSQGSVVAVGRDLYFWSQRGPVRLGGVEQYGDLAPEHGISKNIINEIAKANWSRADRVASIHRADEDIIEWYYSPKGSTRNTRGLAFNILTGAMSPITGREVRCGLSYMNSSGEYIAAAGDSVGVLNRIGTGLTDSGEVIDTEYVTAWDWAGDIGADKRLLRLTFQCDRDYDADVYVQWDGGTWNFLGNLKDLNSTTGYAWDDDYWDIGYWDIGQTGDVDAYPLGHGKKYRLKFVADSENTSFHLLGYEALLSVRPNR